MLTEGSLGIQSKTAVPGHSCLFCDRTAPSSVGLSAPVCCLWCTALMPPCSESVTHTTDPAVPPWLPSVSSRLLWKGSQQALGVHDLWPVRKQDSSEEIVAWAEREWEKCHSRTQQWVFALESTPWAQLGSSRWSKQIHSQVLVCESLCAKSVVKCVKICWRTSFHSWKHRTNFLWEESVFDEHLYWTWYETQCEIFSDFFKVQNSQAFSSCR